MQEGELLMRMTRRVAVMVAVICALGAIVLTAVYLRSLKPAPAQQEKPTLTPVAVPTHALTAGTKITAEMLTTKQVPPGSIPAGVVSTTETLVGQTLAEDTPAGELIPRGRLAAYATGAGLSLAVPPGLRAVTVAVDNITGVGGFLKLGDRVDVLVTFDVASRSLTKTVLQNVLVLGVGTESVVPSSPPSSGGQAAPAEGAGGAAQPAAEGGAQPAAQPAQPANQAKPMPSVTLAVTPDQAQALVLSVKKGSVYLALRPRSDTQMVALAPSSNATILGAENIAPLPAPGNAAPGGTQVARAANQQTPGAGVPGAPGAAAGAASGRPGVEVLRGTGSREVVTP